MRLFAKTALNKMFKNGLQYVTLCYSTSCMDYFMFLLASPRHILRVPGYGLLWQGAPVLVAIEGEEKEEMKGLAEPKKTTVCCMFSVCCAQSISQSLFNFISRGGSP